MKLHKRDKYVDLDKQSDAYLTLPFFWCSISLSVVERSILGCAAVDFNILWYNPDGYPPINNPLK